MELRQPRRRGGARSRRTRASVAIHNPLSEDQSVMRTDLIGGLLDAAAHNLARGVDRVGPVRVGPRLPAAARTRRRRSSSTAPSPGIRSAPIAEPHRIGCVVIGELRPGLVAGAPRANRLLRGEGADRADRRRARRRGRPSCPATRPFLHPSRAADVRLGERSIGWIGELHPSVLGRIDASSGVAFEIDAGPLVDSGDPGAGALRGRHHPPRHRRGHRGDRRPRGPGRADPRGDPRRRQRAAALGARLRRLRGRAGAAPASAASPSGSSSAPPTAR